jgi:RNA polymerase sigma-70 factor, ECF subfamily
VDTPTIDDLYQHLSDFCDLIPTAFLFWKIVYALMYGHLGSEPRPSPFSYGRRNAVSSMSSPPNGRALAFPVLWGTEKETRIAGPQAAEIKLPSDEDLMARLQTKDSKGLELLYTRYSRLVFGIALRIVNDKSEAEEVVQEVFFSLYQKALLFDPAKGSGKSWVVQIAFSRARDRRAHLLRRGFYSGTDIESLDDTLQGQSDIEREVGLRIDFSHLLSAFEDLTEMQRRTLELFYFQGLELREISERLNEPFGNVRHHFYRGLERLRKSPAVKRLKETQNV